MNNLNVDTGGDTFSSLIELAANDDVDAFKRSLECDPSSIDELGLWYCRQKGSKQMVYDHRTPLMVASMYGSTDVVKLIISLSIVDVNKSCGLDKTTALHCAASGGSANSVEVVKLLLKAGADVNAVDIHGRRPNDVITASPKLQDVKLSLEDLLTINGSTISSSPSTPESPPSPINPKFDDQTPISYTSEKKEYPIDPSIPDIKNSIYSTDEFRMYQFKVRPCSRAYSHDWTECPFVHPGENARRRDPRKFHYSCVPCPEFRKGACRRGDMCEYAHGVFESWLHPAQYRTRLCKDGTGCNRRVCFFAHTHEELRPLYMSPRSSSTALPPGSPSGFTPPISPSGNGSMPWGPQQDVPSLRLPGSNLQSSRLRSSLNARDMISAEELEFDLQQQRLLSELNFLSVNSMNRSSGRSIRTLNPSNLDELYFSEISSPTHKSAIFNQFQQLSPINTMNSFSPKNGDHHFLQGSSSGRMSPRSVDPISPMSGRSPSAFGPHLHQFRSLSSRDLYSNTSSSIVGSPVHSHSGWNKPDEPDGGMRRSSSFELGNNSEEPDLSWVQSLVKESNPESYDESVIAGWVQQMQT